MKYSSYRSSNARSSSIPTWIGGESFSFKMSDVIGWEEKRSDLATEIDTFENSLLLILLVLLISNNNPKIKIEPCRMKTYDKIV